MKQPNRSAEALEYRRLYQSAWWRRQREAQLSKEPLCRFCLDAGITTEATVVDHIIPHRGDLKLFHDPKNLQSLDKRCHDRLKSQIESRGYHDHVGLDGLPTCVDHPFNRPRR